MTPRPSVQPHPPATRVYADVVSLPMAKLGAASRLPRLRFQQPTPDKPTPPSRGLRPEELSNAFDWGKDSILPYGVYEDYDRRREPATMPVIVLDNGLLRVTLAPQYGGRIMALYDHRLKRDLVFCNEVFQPANLAALNAWFSGGIEWNGLIPGHSPFTCAPVFCGVVETDRGPVLRIYEFDRIVEATWQIDLFLPEGDDRLYVHGRIVNAADTDKLAYWWTNVAVAATPGLRVISPADDAIEHVLPGNELVRFPFPDPDRFDGSYPENWSGSTSVFFRKPSAPRLYLAALDAEGTGLAQTATAMLAGRKFFYFGTARGGRHWMDYLSEKGRGDYIEIQSGITPTQNQRFPLPARSSVEWTEVYAALSVDPHLVHGRDYVEAERATANAIDQRFPQSALTDADRFLSDVARRACGHRLSQGSRWGERQEKLTGRPLAAGLDFAVSGLQTFWDDLAAGEKVSPDNLQDVPEEFALSPLWCEALEDNASRHGRHWLHDLLLGLAAHDRGEVGEARALLLKSVSVHPSWLGLRHLALAEEDVDAAIHHYLAAHACKGSPPELAVEIARFLLAHDRLDQLENFVGTLPPEIAALERIELARAQLAARCGDFDLLETLLSRELATIREGETLTADLWAVLQDGRLRQKLGREPTQAEFERHATSHPLPEHLDFRMRTIPEDGTGQ